MAENKEKTEAELLEESMQNLGLEEVIEEKKSEDLLIEGSSPLTDEEIESFIKDDDSPLEEIIEEIKSEDSLNEANNSIEDEISPVDDINLNNTETEDNLDIELDEEVPVQKKQNKFIKILTIIVSVLLSLVSIGAVLYLIGFFDPEPVKEAKIDKTMPQKEEYKFTPKDIDTKRLNKKLNLLTKYEIVENADTEEKKAQEKENLYLEAKKQLEMERLAKIEKIKDAERKRMQEELPVIKKQDIDENIDKEIDNVIAKDDSTKDDNSATTEENSTIEKPTEVNTTEQKVVVKENETLSNTNSQETAKKVEETKEPEKAPTSDTTVESKVASKEPVVKKEKINQFVKVIKIPTKSKDIYKSYLDKIYSVNDKVTLCRDYQNNVEIFIGPFENDASREKVAQEYLLKYNINVEIYDYTRDEYDKRCNY